MIGIPGYQIIDTVYESSRTVVFRARQESEQRPVILKVLKREHPPPKDVARYEREYEILRSLEISGVARAYGLEKHGDGLILILEDFEGQALKGPQQVVPPWEILDFLALAEQVARILGQIHDCRVIHRDLSSYNILFNPVSGQVRIVDFDLAMDVDLESPEASSPNILVGRLNYLSPEQTGRTNHRLDHRTDLYSLGVVFYELLTGSPPFEGLDPAETIHAHLAVTPRLPEGIRPDIPGALSDLVLKLLAKDPDERYQSALGLATDLGAARRKWETTGVLKGFSPRYYAVPANFKIPGKIYGREKETNILLEEFERVQAGAVSLTMVSGWSGMGKTCLVNNIQGIVNRSGGLFIAGKFDSIRGQMPYSGLVQAFQELMRRLLSESRSELVVWREKLIEALGENGQVIIDVIPELERIIGPQPPAPELDPASSQGRFIKLFQSFVQLFGQTGRPLVLFLDDLQWIDTATVKLVEFVFSDENASNLMFIGAFRDNEVDADHALASALAAMESRGVGVKRVLLEPLGAEDTGRLVADTLGTSRQQVQALADIVNAKTGGNPFFVNQFLSALHTEKLLRFDSWRPAWGWDLNRVIETTITDNVAELLSQRLERLPEVVRRVISRAACFGSRFDLDTLAKVTGSSLKEIRQWLSPAVRLGLILAAAEQKTAEPEDTLVSGSSQYMFLHDRVQQAAYDRISDTEKAEAHLTIGRSLRETLPDQPNPRRTFEVADHLNLGGSLIEEERERIDLAGLNLSAGRMAMKAMAFEAAAEYMALGMEFLSDRAWETDYSLAWELNMQRAGAEFMIGRGEQSEELLFQTIERSRTSLEKAVLYFSLSRQRLFQGDYPQTRQYSVAGLRFLGLDIPDDDFGPAVRKEHELVRRNLGSRPASSLADIPFIDDPEKSVMMNLIGNIANAHVLADELFELMILKSINLMMAEGIPIEGIPGFSGYGVILCSMYEEYAKAYDFGRLAIHLAEISGNLNIQAMVHGIFAWHISHWGEHIRKAEFHCRKGHQAALEGWDIFMTSHFRWFFTRNLFYQEKPLAPILEQTAECLAFCRKFRYLLGILCITGMQLTILELTGIPREDCGFTLEVNNEEDYMALCRDRRGQAAFFEHLSSKCVVSYLGGRPEEIADLVEKEDPISKPVFKKMFGGVWINFYHSLALLALFEEAPADKKRAYDSLISSNQEQMRVWAEACPANYGSKYLLVEAERARVARRDIEAMDLYDQAIASARENEFLLKEALANELAGKFHRSRGRNRVASVYLADAFYKYRRWGAEAKVRKMREEYPELAVQPPALGASDPLSGLGFSVSISGEKLDLAAVFKASQAISSEIVLDRLLDKIMKILVENAGAEKGFLVLKEGENLAVRAGYPRGVGETKPAAFQTVEECPDLSPAIVNYVARTGENMVLGDAFRDGRFTRDEYIIKNKPRSVICTPIDHQGELTGVLYLENNLSSGAFTLDHLEVLSILASQAAISLENARLFQNLEESTERIRAAEEKYHGIFDHALEGMFQIKADGRTITAVNQALAGILGYDAPDEIISSIQILEQAFAASEDMDRFRQLMNENGRIVGEEVQLQRREGQKFWALLNCSAVKDREGRVLSYEGSLLDVTVRKEAEAELAAYQKKLRALSAELSAAEERERRRLARDLHDGVSQSLALSISRLKAWTHKNAIEYLIKDKESVLSTLSEALEQIRTLTFELSPPVLYDYGLEAALEWLSENIEDRYGLSVAFQVRGEPGVIGENLRVVLYRSVRELLINAVKHARAERVQILVEHRDSQVNIMVEDDGVGLRAKQEVWDSGKGFGLFGVRERLKTLGGVMEIDSSPNRGTRIVLTAPISNFEEIEP